MEQCLTEGFTKEQMYVERFADVRYIGQEHTIKVNLYDGKITKGSLETLEQHFHDAHQKEYSFKLTNSIELVNYHVVVFGKIDKQPLAEKPVTGRTLADAYKGTRKVDFDDHGIHDADIYDLALLEPGMNFESPAIIEDATNTIVITPNKDATMDFMAIFMLKWRKNNEHTRYKQSIYVRNN